MHDAYRRRSRTGVELSSSSTSRCTTRGATSSREAMWRAMRSATVTERWRPPVQPIAIVRWRLALGDVGGEQEVEQRQQAPVVLARELAGLDVLDHRGVPAG